MTARDSLGRRRSPAQIVGRHHITSPVGDRPWTADAACRGTATTLFFPSEDTARVLRAARAVCASCPVIDDCRETHWGEEFGIWFGTSERERRRLRRQMREEGR